MCYFISFKCRINANFNKCKDFGRNTQTSYYNFHICLFTELLTNSSMPKKPVNGKLASVQKQITKVF